MIKTHNSKKRKITREFEINEFVTILVDKLDRFSIDLKRIPAKIISKSGNKQVFYTLLTQHGILSQKLEAGCIDKYHGIFEVDQNLLSEWTSKNITKSIREVAKAFNQHQPKKINFSKLHCSCRGKCFEDARCKCFQNKQPCSSHCTNHLTGSNSKCKNISH